MKIADYLINKNYNSLISSFTFQFISAIVSLITIRMYSELLSSDNLGYAMLLLGVIALFDAILSSSISQIIFYYGSSKKTNKLVHIVLISLFNKLLKYSISILLVILLCFFLNSTISTFLDTTITVVLLLAFYLVSEPLKSGLLSYLNIVSTRSIYGLQVVIESSLTLLFVFMALLYREDWSSLCIGIIIARYVSVFSIIFLLDKTNKIDQSMKVRLAKVRVDYLTLIKHVKPIMYMGLLGWFNNFADRYLLTATLNVSSVGYYSLGTGLVNKPYAITTAAVTAHFRPSLYSSLKNNSQFETKKILQKWLLSTFFIGFIGVLSFFIFRNLIVSLILSEVYREYVKNFLWLIAIYQTLSISIHVFDNSFLARGLGDFLLRVQILTIPITLAVVAIGAMYWGIEGAIIGRLMGDIIKFIITGYYTYKAKLI